MAKGRGSARGIPEWADEPVRTDQAIRRPVRAMARVSGIPASGFRAWRGRRPSGRRRRDAALARRIRADQAVSHGTYGAPRVDAEPHVECVHAGRKRVARLMREAGIARVGRRRGTVAGVVPAPRRTCAGDLVRRAIVANEPETLCVAKIAFVRTAASPLFSAARHRSRTDGAFAGSLLDAWSRRIVVWAISHGFKTQA